MSSRAPKRARDPRRACEGDSSPSPRLGMTRLQTYAVPLIEVVVAQPGAQFLQNVGRKRALHCRDIQFDLTRVARAGNRRGYRLVRQTDTQCAFGEISCSTADDRLDLIDPFQRLLQSSLSQ